jgi:hypothetical protein
VTARQNWPLLLSAAALALLYAAVASGHFESMDGGVMFKQGVSLAIDHSIHFRRPVYIPDLAWTSKFPIGLSLLYLPGITFVAWIFPALGASAAQASDAALWKLYALTGAPIQILISAGSALLVGVLIRRLGGGLRLALTGMVVYGIASPGFIYARMDFSQGLVGFWWMLGLWAALPGECIHLPRTWGRRAGWGGMGLMMLAQFGAVITRPLEGSLLLPALLLLRRRPSSLLAVLTSYAAGAGVDMLVAWARYGNPFLTGYEKEHFDTPFWVGLAGSLLSPGRGLLWSLPIVLLVPFGVRWLWRRDFRAAGLAMLTLILGMLAIVSPWWAWWGGYAYGLRLFVPALPAVAVLATLGIPSIPKAVRPWLVGSMVFVGLICALPGVFVDMLSGYAALADQTEGSWKLLAYPPLGALHFRPHLRGFGITDIGSVDIIWFRIARRTHELSLVPPLLLGGLSVLCGWWAIRAMPVQAQRVES